MLKRNFPILFLGATLVATPAFAQHQPGNTPTKKPESSTTKQAERPAEKTGEHKHGDRMHADMHKDKDAHAMMMMKSMITGEIDLSDVELATIMHQNHQHEIEMCELAAERASSAQVKTLAKQIGADHKKADKALTALATKKGWDLGMTATGMASAELPKVETGATGTMGTTGMAGNKGNVSGTAGTTAKTGDVTGSGNTGATAGNTGSTSGTGTVRSTGQMATATTGEPSNMQLHEMNMKKKMEKMEKLKAMSGAELDRAFLITMQKGHNDSIMMLTAQAFANPIDKDLRAEIKKSMPTLEKHRSLSIKALEKEGAKAQQPAG